MNNKYKIFCLIGIIIFAAVLRLWQLGLVPSSPDWDEVALGYNAYSILETGKDEYGKPIPVVLRSYDDYKPALYAYLAIPPVAIFGLNTFAVRLPSAIFGILTVLVTYFLVKELFKRDDIALLSSFLLSISPWHIQFSRVAFESNIGLSLNVFAVLFFIKGLKKPWLLSIAAVCSALSIYAYQSEKVFTPLLIAALCVIYYKNLLKLPKKFIALAIIVGLIFISPMAIYISTNKEALTRAQSTLAFADKTVYLKGNLLRYANDKNSNDLLGLVFDNRRVSYLKTGISGYLSHFDLNWLFIRGDNPRHHAPGMGLLYLWELPFILLGIYHLIFSKNLSKQSKEVIFAWFLVAPLPAAFTVGVPHAVRTLNFLPTFQVFTAVGIIAAFGLVQRIQNKILRLTLLSFYVLCFTFNLFYYLNQYFIQQNYFHAYDWQYGYEKTVSIINENESKYKRIIVSDKSPMNESYMFFLFYLKYSPDLYQGNNHKFDKYEFHQFDWDKNFIQNDTLYVGTPEDFPADIKPLGTINYPDGKPAMLIIENK